MPIFAYCDQGSRIIDQIKNLPQKMAALNCELDQICVELPENHGLAPGRFLLAAGGVWEPTPPEPLDMQEEWIKLRIARNRKLLACDWTQIPDATVDQAAWAAYRSALRELPNNTADPTDVVWPTAPGA